MLSARNRFGAQMRDVPKRWEHKLLCIQTLNKARLNDAKRQRLSPNRVDQAVLSPSQASAVVPLVSGLCDLAVTDRCDSSES